MIKCKSPRLWGAAIAALAVSAVLVSSAGAVAPEAIYDSIPKTLAPDLPSLGFSATKTAEFGDDISFNSNRPTTRLLRTVSVAMSTSAKHSEYPTILPAGRAWTQPITLNLYNVVLGSPHSLGSLIATRTATFAIPWRPESDAACAARNQWKAGDGNCYSGLAFTIRFDFSSAARNVILPDELIYGIAFSTANRGPDPYVLLKLALNSDPDSIATGKDVEPDALFWNTATAANYADNGAGGVGTFRRDTEHAPSSPAVTFLATDTQARISK